MARGTPTAGRRRRVRFSVGGGDLEKNINANIVQALQLAPTGWGAYGRDRRLRGGYTAKVADAAVVIPTSRPTGDVAHRGAPGSHLAPDRVASCAEAARDEVVVGGVNLRAVFLDRVLNRNVFN
jgi:hypothetical protein